MNIARKILAGLLAILAVSFMIYIYWMKTQPNPSDWEAESLGQISISSGRYPELLKQALTVKLIQQADEVEIYLTNTLTDLPIPSEEPHRAIVCTTEIFKDNGERIGRYQEYFKPLSPSLRGKTPSPQIAPGQTATLGYVLEIPHGLVRVIVTYEDFSKQLQGETCILELSTNKLKF